MVMRWLRVIDSTALCVPTHPRLMAIERVELVVVHRLRLSRRTEANPDPVPDNRLDARAVSAAFSNRAMGTGCRTPYTALGRTDGAIEQLLGLGVQGAHAKGYNGRSWSLAVVGNWDEIEMPEHTVEMMLDALAVLAVVPREVAGHTELPGSSSDPGKRCPGRHLSMDWVRTQVERRLPRGSELWDLERRLEYVTRAGFVA